MLRKGMLFLVVSCMCILSSCIFLSQVHAIEDEEILRLYVAVEGSAEGWSSLGNDADKKYKIDSWVDEADYALDTAKALLQTQRFLFVGFMCHLSIEKLLKAMLIKVADVEPPHIHHLVHLAEMGHVYQTLTDAQRMTMGELMPLNIESRYPTRKNAMMKKFNREKCEELLSNTEDLSRWIKGKLSERIDIMAS